MKISVQNLKHKLSTGWRLVCSDGTVLIFARGADLDVKLLDDGKITVIRKFGSKSIPENIYGCNNSGPVKPIAVTHPKDESKVIAIDKIIQGKIGRPTKSKITIVVGDVYMEHNQNLALYIYYKASKVLGKKNVKIVQHQTSCLDDEDVSNSKFKKAIGSTEDTHVIVCGMQKGYGCPDLSGCVHIPYIGYASALISKINPILVKLEKIGLKPEISKEDEADKLTKILIGILAYSPTKSPVFNYLNIMLSSLSIEEATSTIIDVENSIMDKYFSEMIPDASLFELEEFKDIKEVCEDKEIEASYLMLSKHMIECIDEGIASYIKIKPKGDVFQKHFFNRHVNKMTSITAKLYPETPIAVWDSDTDITLYSNVMGKTDNLVGIMARVWVNIMQAYPAMRILTVMDKVRDW